MKKLFTLVAFATIMFAAGTANAQLSVNGGFMSGIASSQFKFTNPVTNKEEKRDTAINAGVGVYAGLSYNLNFTEHWGVAPGIYINYIGKSEEKTLATYYTDMVDINVPILFNYKRDFTSSFGIMGFVGPNICYGLSATYTVKDKNTNNTDKTDLYKNDATTGEPYYTRTDLGLVVGIGVHFNAFQIQTGFNFGLLDREPNKNVTTNFHQYFVGVGFVF